MGAFTLVMTVGVLSFSNVQASGRRLGAGPEGRGWFANSARSAAPITYRDAFQTVGPEWIPATVHSAGGIRAQLGAGAWRVTAGGVAPGLLYLWKPTLDLRDYDLTFQAIIRHGGVGWTFRASDAGTLHAAKLVLGAGGPDSAGCLQRFRRVDGRESPRHCEVEPLSLEAGTPHTVRVRVSGDEFTVSMDGATLATWRDARLGAGGIGFFAEEGDSTTIREVTVSERDSLLGRLAAYFSLIPSPIR